MNYIEKKTALLSYLKELAGKDSMVAFSGGVDSSLLLRLCCDAAKDTGRKVYAVTIHTKLHPVKDLEIARKVAREAGARHLVVAVDELEEAGIRYNPTNRCYLCKKCLFKKLLAKAGELGVSYILEGTNADDLHVYRPGIRALSELGILSPLSRFGFSKAEIRQMAAEYKLSVADRPSTPCMATRLPYGTELNYALIRNIEQAESWLREKGFRNVRLRVHGKIARIEVDAESIPLLISLRDETISEFRQYGFDYITLDLEGFRSGSMDIGLEK